MSSTRSRQRNRTKGAGDGVTAAHAAERERGRADHQAREHGDAGGGNLVNPSLSLSENVPARLRETAVTNMTPNHVEYIRIMR